jgi:hypothetical protein
VELPPWCCKLHHFLLLKRGEGLKYTDLLDMNGVFFLSTITHKWLARDPVQTRREKKEQKNRKNEKFYIVDKRLDTYHSMAFNHSMNKNHLKIII